MLGFVAACGGQVQQDPGNAGGGGYQDGGSGPGGGVGGGSSGSSASSGFGGGTAGSGAVGTGGATPGGSGGYGNFAGAPPKDRLGDSCSGDSECDYMKCFGPLHVGGGVPHGVCSFDCANDPKICDVVPGASCQQVGGSSFCVAPCTLGPDGSKTFDKTKCDARPELACAELDDGKVGCLPNCNGDFDCPYGTSCNPKTGLCQVGSVSGAPTGAQCGGSSECKGECVDGMCFDPCTIGALPSCGWGGPGTGPAPAFCVDLGAPFAYGDRAHCFKLCNCDGDCGGSGMACKLLDDPAVAKLTEKKGRCIPTAVPYLPCK